MVPWWTWATWVWAKAVLGRVEDAKAEAGVEETLRTVHECCLRYLFPITDILAIRLDKRSLEAHPAELIRMFPRQETILN